MENFAVRKSKYNDCQIGLSPRQTETRTSVAEVVRKMGTTEQPFYCWKKYGGLGDSEPRRLRQLEKESRKPEPMVADLSLDKHMLQEDI